VLTSKKSLELESPLSCWYRHEANENETTPLPGTSTHNDNYKADSSDSLHESPLGFCFRLICTFYLHAQGRQTFCVGLGTQVSRISLVSLISF
jgi:hypothetical protein